MSAIGYPAYKRKPERFWKGRKVRSLRVIRNGHGSLPAGTVFAITRKHRGFELRSEPCRCCGFRLTVSHVRPEHMSNC